VREGEVEMISTPSYHLSAEGQSGGEGVGPTPPSLTSSIT
jgi:hypothetical protein